MNDIEDIIRYLRLEHCAVRLRDTNYISYGKDVNVLSPVVTICTTNFNIKNSTFRPHSVFYVSQNKQRSFPYTTLSDWFS